jgi:hypothetical protein
MQAIIPMLATGVRPRGLYLRDGDPPSVIAVSWPNLEASRANSANNILKLESRELNGMNK